MNKSETTAELAKALSKAQGLFDHAKKDVKNEFFKSKYADLASVIDAAKKPLSDNGLCVSQIVGMSESGDETFLETILMHTSGEYIISRYPIRPIKTDPQSMGSAITYARRYAFSAIAGIAADDDDGNEASQAKPATKPQKPVEKPAQSVQLSQADEMKYSNELDQAKTMQELGKAWTLIPAELKPFFESYKNTLKAKFLPPKTEAA